MKISSICSLTVLAAGAFAKLQIILPNTHTEWEAGGAEAIRWKPIDGPLKGRVSIELMEGSDPSNMDTVTTIAENIPANNMQVSWNVPRNLKSSSSYAIKIVDDNGDEYYGRYFKGIGSKGDAGKNKNGALGNARDSKGAGSTDSDQSKSQQSAGDAEESSDQRKGSKNVSKSLRKDAGKGRKDSNGEGKSTNSAVSHAISPSGAAAAIACMALAGSLLAS